MRHDRRQSRFVLEQAHLAAAEQVVRREELTGWLSRIAVPPGDEAVAATWRRLSAAAIWPGRPRPANGMWVAARCLTHGILPAALNLRGLRILGREQQGGRLAGS